MIVKAVDGNIITATELPIGQIVRGQGGEEKKLLLGKYLSASKILGDETPEYVVQFADGNKSGKWGAFVALTDLLVCRLFASPRLSRVPKYIPMPVLRRINGVRHKILSQALHHTQSVRPNPGLNDGKSDNGQS